MKNMEQKKATIQKEEVKKIPLEDRPEYQSIRNCILGIKKRQPKLTDEQIEEAYMDLGII